MQHDQNGDGRVTEEEVPEDLKRVLVIADVNEDGAVDRTEAEGLMEFFVPGGGRGRGQGGPRGGGRRGPNRDREGSGDRPQRPEFETEPINSPDV